MKGFRATGVLLTASLLAAGSPAASGPGKHHPATHRYPTVHRSGAPAPALWIGSWAAAQQTPEPANQLPEAGLHGALLRQVVHLSAGGEMIRIRISNACGAVPLHLLAAQIAPAAPGQPGAIGASRALSFSGRADVTVPAGAEYLSDPLAMPVAPFADLAVTLRLDALAAQPCGHPGARATSFLAPDGDPAVQVLSGATTFEHWYVLAGVEVFRPAARGVVVAFGDSITDGRGSVPDANNRWPDDLARRLGAVPATRGIGVLNMGIGGNRVLLDGLGPNGLARFERDVLAHGAVRWLIVLEGINDLGVLTRDAPATPQQHAELVARLTAAYAQLVARAHAHGIKVMGGTLMPWMSFTYYHPDAANEADRQAVNAWIRAAGHFDAVADFDAALRDPADPTRLLPLFESGDHLHPSPAGYQAMADLVPLTFFAPQGKKR